MLDKHRAKVFGSLASSSVEDAMRQAEHHNLMKLFHLDRDKLLDRGYPANLLATSIVHAVIPLEFMRDREGNRAVMETVETIATKIEAARNSTQFPTIDLGNDERTVAGSLFAIPDGYYTVALVEGGHRTFKLRPWRSRPDGTRVLSLLVGSDNENDYKGLGTVSPDGRVRLWNDVRLSVETRTAVEVLANSSNDELANLREGFAIMSGRCARCRRLLTVPASINRGLGPECAGKI